MRQADRLKEILFRNPSFLDGINVSVRNGRKWANFSEKNDVIDIKNVENNEVVGKARIDSLIPCDYDNIPESFFKRIHSGETTKEELRKNLDELYDNHWGPEITLVLFTVE